MKQKKLLRSYWTTLSLWLIALITITGIGSELIHVHADQALVAPNTIFTDTTLVKISITTAGVIGKLSYIVNDLDGSLVDSGTVPAFGLQTDVILPKLPDGYYILTVVDHTVASNPIQKIPFAIIAPAIESDNRFGLAVHFGGNNASLVPLLSALGIGVVRSDITWSQVEHTPGQYAFDTYDGSLQVLQENALQPLLILDYNNRFYDSGQTPYDDAGLNAFANYAKSVVTHYGSQVKAVEIYNEYNGLFSNGPCARKASCYARMLQYSYEAIKAIRPDVSVVGGVAYGVDLAWFQQLFQAGGLRYMDVLSDHPYVPGNLLSPERTGTKSGLEMIQAMMRLYNGGVVKPLWITEMGWPTTLLGINERMQAQYLVRGAVLSLAAGAQKFFWYDEVNDGRRSYMPEENFGLLRLPDSAGRYTPKPAFVAYASLIRQLAGQRFVREQNIGSGVYDERFEKVHVLWSTGAGMLMIRASGPVTITTMLGKNRVYSPFAGLLMLPLSQDPIYVSTTDVSQIVTI